MSGRTTRVALALLTTLVACLAMTPVALRAEPAAASDDDCLAKPNGQAPAGSHWFYRVERASGRRCWHLRAQADNADEKADQGEGAATRSVSAPASPPAATSPEPVTNSGDNAQSAPVPADWPSAPAPSRSTSPITNNAAHVTRDNAGAAEHAPAARAVDPQIDAPAVDANSGSAPPAAAPVPPMAPAEPIAARPATSTIDPNHLPALLGTALVLLVIIFGSIAAHFASSALQRRRQRRAVRAALPSSWDAPDIDGEAADLRAAPVPARQARREERETDVHLAPRETLPFAAAGGASAQALEENVRALLQRLRSDLKPTSQRLAPSSPPSELRLVPPATPPVPGDLEAALAVWAGNKKRVPQ